MTIHDHDRTRLRRIESGLAYFSLGSLLLYIPLETYVSWPSLHNPGYLVDVIGFVLLAFGGLHSLRARPHQGIAPLCAAWGYCACNGWRAYFGRVDSRVRGLSLYTGLNKEPIVENAVGVATVIAFVVLILCLCVAYRNGRHVGNKKGDAA